MRRFDAEYLDHTRRGMWEDRDALSSLELSTQDRVLDVGCGTGELTRILREETPGTVVGLDADDDLLEAVGPPVVVGDARELPFDADTFDLVVCQALLINLRRPGPVLEEFRRVSRNRVALIEPDNSAVSIESTVDTEPAVTRRARELYLDGVETDISLGARGQSLVESAGMEPVDTTRYDHVRTITAPYSDHDLEDARKKASGRGLDSDRETILAGNTSPGEYDRLRDRWRDMGRDVISQMREGTYERTERVPFYVTVADV